MAGSRSALETLLVNQKLGFLLLDSELCLSAVCLQLVIQVMIHFVVLGYSYPQCIMCKITAGVVSWGKKRILHKSYSNLCMFIGYLYRAYMPATACIYSSPCQLGTLCIWGGGGGDLNDAFIGCQWGKLLFVSGNTFVSMCKIFFIFRFINIKSK